MKKDKVIMGILLANLFLIALLFLRMEHKNQAELDAMVLGDDEVVATEQPSPIQEVDRSQEIEEAPAPQTQAAPVVPVIVAETLDNSDAKALEAVMALNPDLAQWLVGEERIRKFVLMINTLALAELPSKHLPINMPVDAFTVHEAGLDAEQNKLYRKAEVNHQRLRPLVEAVTQVPPATMAAYYRAWLPVLNEAYTELGESGSFHQRFVMAMNNVQGASAIANDAVLIQPHIFYQFADVNNEDANAISKWLWRLGPDNSKDMQTYLKALSAALR